KTPVIFTLTPYISDTYHARGAYFALHGYVFALVDVRGRGNSSGEFEPFANEPRDGHDVVEWLAKQPFCDGKVAMWGGSYAGFDQWATAKEFPPHLATIVPAAAAHPGLDYPSTQNVGLTYDMQWYTLTSGHAAQDNLFADQKFWRTKFLDAYKKHIPFKSLDSFVGNPSLNFQRILKHPVIDAYYDAVVPTREQFQKITLPILTITAQYDGDELGALSYYRDHLANASLEARAKHQSFYHDSKNGDANGVFRSSSLTEKRANEGLDTFIYDPLDTTHGETVDGIDPKEKTAGIDQTYASSIGKDGLVYHTEPLPKETPLIGCPAVTLWASIDTPDVDLSAHLFEIQPDGTSIALCIDIRRS